MKIDEYSELFKALGHPLRLKIVCGLSRKDECCVTVMAEKLKIAQPKVSQHLNILKNANIIEGYRKGTKICYKLVNPLVKKLIESMEVNICE